ncbi:hypothetical protein MAH1_16950 [Sessilibacter sp. MAH1]
MLKTYHKLLGIKLNRVLGIVILAISLSACVSPFSDDESVARDELLSIAPIGSDAREAKPKLEAKGFKCHWAENRSFLGLEGIHNYLYCDKSIFAGPLVTQRWQLALVHESFVVTNAKFGIGLTGP